jgi:UPF0755 protein
MKHEDNKKRRKRGIRRVIYVCLAILILLIVAAVFVRRYYYVNLRPVSHSNKSQTFTIKSGESVPQIASDLEDRGLIRSDPVFRWYVLNNDVRSKLQAGTYSLRPSMDVPHIVSLFAHGEISSKLVTILPGHRIDQVRDTFRQAGYSPQEVSAALNPSNYPDASALADKPQGASLEGFLFPDSYKKDDNTKLQTIVSESLAKMGDHLTPQIRKSFANEGLSVYQGITLASVVQKEVSKPKDRAQAAQVFLLRLKKGIPLGSDVTAYYGAIKAGHKPTVDYPSPYNTHLHKGLPAGPISTVSESSLKAVAHPADTHWLYFVTGDDGTTHFSKTLKQHQAYTKKYCHKLCSSP